MENQTREKFYKIMITVAIYRDGLLSYKSELMVPTVYRRRSEARSHIKKEIAERLQNTNFFRSPRLDYDLVRYTEEARCNTFLRYTIIDSDTLLKNEERLTQNPTQEK